MISHVHIALKIVLEIFEFSYALKHSISLYLCNKNSLQNLKIYDANVKHHCPNYLCVKSHIIY